MWEMRWPQYPPKNTIGTPDGQEVVGQEVGEIGPEALPEHPLGLEGEALLDRYEDQEQDHDPDDPVAPREQGDHEGGHEREANEQTRSVRHVHILPPRGDGVMTRMPGNGDAAREGLDSVR